MASEPAVQNHLWEFVQNPGLGGKFVAQLFTCTSFVEYTPTNKKVVFQFRDVSDDETVTQLFSQLRIENNLCIRIPKSNDDDDKKLSRKDKLERELCDNHSKVFTLIMEGDSDKQKTLSTHGSSSKKKKKKMKMKKDKKLEKRSLQKVEMHEFVWPPPHKGRYRVNIHGYICRCGSGRYGAIVRDYVGLPKAATSGVSEPISLVYHMLEGVKCGLILAKDYGCREVDVCTSSNYIILLIRKCLQPIHEDPKVYEILKEINELLSEFQDFFFMIHPTQSNRAAEYLSKFHGQNVLDGSVPARPPTELCTIVYQDASGTAYCNE